MLNGLSSFNPSISLLIIKRANVVADALSRRHTLFDVLQTKLIGFELIKEYYYKKYVDFNPIIEECVKETVASYVLQDGFIFKGKMLCICSCSIRELLVREAHGGGIVGYFSIIKTLAILQEHFIGLKCKETYKM